MKHSLSAALILSLALAAPTFATTKKSKKPTGTPSTLPPTSPMLVVPKPDGSASDDGTSSRIISSEMTGRDLEFFTKAVDAGRAQAFYVELLKKSASSDIIKKLADALTATQNEENMHLAKLAGQKGWTVSLEPTVEEKKVGGEIAKLSGSNFDKAAMDKVVTASNIALNAYQNAAQSPDAQIKSFAAQMLPLAEEKRHLVEKMTGAGAKAANQLFRHGGASQSTPGDTLPPEAPVDKATPATKDEATPPPAATPSEKGTPAGKSATPQPSAALSLPIATPPGIATPAPQLPPIVPSKAPAPEK
ncbi:MAG TPA: DUF4142 domain-containing protein [Chthoniobacter sp.]|nr:DUF4142 domain-containing protein [Chthoniobacter sp.]